MASFPCHTFLSIPLVCLECCTLCWESYGEVLNQSNLRSVSVATYFTSNSVAFVLWLRLCNLLCLGVAGSRQLIENYHFGSQQKKILQSLWGKGRDFSCIPAFSGSGKDEVVETNPEAGGQWVNICKCLYTSWYKTHDFKWLLKCLNPIRHTQKWMIWTPSVCPFGPCGNGHFSDYLWIWKCV